MNPDIAVSVVISTFNRANQLRETLLNVLKQDYLQMEVIVVDDCSTDHTPEILNEFASRPNFHFIRNPENRGLPTSLNRGIEMAQGAFIARIDDHDLWTDSQKLGKQVAALQNDPGLGVIGTAYLSNQKEVRVPLSDRAIRRQMLYRCPICHVSTVFRKTLWQQVGGYDESLAYGEDWDLWLRMGEVARLKNLADITTKLGSHEISLGQHFFLRQAPIVKGFLKRYGHSYPGRFKAGLYHGFVRLFFRVIPVGSRVHRWAGKVFSRVFQRG